MNVFHYPPVGTNTLRGGCCLTSVGSSVYGRGQKYPVAGHPGEFDFLWERGRVLADFALILIVKGAGEWECQGGESARVSAGDILYLVPGGWHRYRPSRPVGWSEKWVTLQGSVAHGFVRAGMLPDRCAHRIGGISSGLESRLDRLIRTVLAERETNRPSWGLRALSLFLECFGDGGSEGVISPHAVPGVESALRFIRENAHRPIGVREVAVACGLERRTLERHFGRAGVGSIGRRILEERIARAKMLLTESSMQIKEIAFACGFGGAQRMIYDFRKIAGCTPGQVRRRKSNG